MRDESRGDDARAVHDGMLVVRAELCDRLDGLQRSAAPLTCPRFRGLGRLDPDPRRRLRPARRSCGSPTRSSARSRGGEPRGCPAAPLFRPAARRDRLRAQRRRRRAGDARLGLDPPRHLTPATWKLSSPAFSPPLWPDGATRPSCSIAALAARYRRPVLVLAGVAVGALAQRPDRRLRGHTDPRHRSCPRATSCWSPLPCCSPASAGLIRRNQPGIGGQTSGPLPRWRPPSFLAEIGDRTQFLTFALAGLDSIGARGVGATAGRRSPACRRPFSATAAALLPMRAIRIAIAALFLLAGFVVAVNALAADLATRSAHIHHLTHPIAACAVIGTSFTIGRNPPWPRTPAALKHADRPRKQCRPLGRRRAQRGSRRQLRALPQDQEFPLARLGPAFPRLSSAARRAGDADPGHHRRDRRAGAQDRRYHPALDRRYRPAPAYRRQ